MTQKLIITAALLLGVAACQPHDSMGHDAMMDDSMKGGDAMMSDDAKMDGDAMMSDTMMADG